MRFAAFALGLMASATTAFADPAGLRILNLYMPHHNAETRVALWYPGDGSGTPERYAENPVFQGVDVAMDAGVEDGAFPLVLFSHGMGGTDRAQAWLASDLAEQGAIVVIVNHLNSTWGSFDMSKGVRHWTRAEDLRAALDAVLADPELGAHIDRSRIMAAGFSYGGWSALSLGGMRSNHAGFVAACETHIEEMAACNHFLSDKANVQGISPELWNASQRDARVSQVVAIDPGFVWGLEAGDVADLDADTLFIGFGGPDIRMMDTDFDASGLADLLPDAAFQRIDPAFHFTAMPVCTPAGPEILEAENDDPVCTDPDGADRAAIHAMIVEAIAERLGL